MPDTGDKVTPSVTVSPFDMTTLAALTVIAPDGSTTAGTGEATAGGGIWTANQVTIVEGVQVLHWVVTGVGAGVTDQYLIGLAPATGLELPPAFATIADVIARLPAGRTLSNDELQALPGKLSDAAVKLRAFCRKRFTEVEDEEFAIRPTGNYIQLPNKPVFDVTSVAAITRDGDVALDGWYWDGIDRIYLGCPWPDEGEDSWNGVAYSFRVVASSGAVPELIRTMNAQIALRHAMSPSPVEGMVNEKIGQYSYLMQQGHGTPGNQVRLSDEDKEELRDAGFRRTAGTSTLTAV